MKMGAFVSVAAVLTLPLVLQASAQAVGGPATLSSTLTSTTTSQVLNLTTAVTANGPGSFHCATTSALPVPMLTRMCPF